jgi:hypothetical protein
MKQTMTLNSIPEYRLNDSLNQRMSSLVLFEQYSDERTVTAETIKDLNKIVKIADQNNETKLSRIAMMILDHCQKYMVVN